MKFRNLFGAILLVSLTSCGSALTTTLIESLVTPQSIATTLIDYQIQKETGKKVSEHALSAVTSKDCKFDVQTLSVCKDHILDYLNVKIVSNIKNSYLSKIE